MVVVAVQEPGQCLGSFVVAGPGLAVGPFPGQGPVVPLDLPVGLRPVRAGPLMDRRPESGPESFAAVAGTVVGEHPVNLADAVRGEELDGTNPETCCGDGLLVGEFLGVRQPGPVIDRGVQVHVPGSLTAFGRPVPVAAPAMGTPPTTGGDPADLLHIDMHQVPAPG